MERRLRRPAAYLRKAAAERGIADRIVTLTRARPIDLLGDDVRRLVWLLDGCALAVHDYLSRMRLPCRLQQSRHGVCYTLVPASR